MSNLRESPLVPPLKETVDVRTTASIGCGSLFLIALVLYWVVGGASNKINKEIRELRNEVRSLRVAVDDQAAAIDGLRDQIQDQQSD